jgi:hypothetical protein
MLACGEFEETFVKSILLGIFLSLVVAVGPDAYGSLVIATGGVAVTQNFDGLTTTGTNLSVLDSAGWVVAGGATPTFAGGTATLSTATINGSSAGNYYNFGNGASTADRAVGFLNSGSFTSPRSLMVEINNNTGSVITDLQLSFDYEKYRSGSRAFDMTFFESSNGSTWTTVAAGNQSYAADANNTTVFSPPTSINKSLTISGLSIAGGSNYYLRWNLAGVGGSTNGQAIGIDNFSVTATVAAVPEVSAFLYGGVIITGLCGWKWRQKRRQEQVLI